MSLAAATGPGATPPLPLQEGLPCVAPRRHTASQAVGTVARSCAAPDTTSASCGMCGARQVSCCARASAASASAACPSRTSSPAAAAARGGGLPPASAPSTGCDEGAGLSAPACSRRVSAANRSARSWCCMRGTRAYSGASARTHSCCVALAGAQRVTAASAAGSRRSSASSCCSTAAETPSPASTGSSCAGTTGWVAADSIARCVAGRARASSPCTSASMQDRSHLGQGGSSRRRSQPSSMVQRKGGGSCGRNGSVSSWARAHQRWAAVVAGSGGWWREKRLSVAAATVSSRASSVLSLA